MAYKPKTREKAFALYCEGKTLAQISKKLKIRRSTLSTWKARYKWEKRRTETEQKAHEKTDNWRAREMAKAVKGHFEVARGLRGAITKKLKRVLRAASPNTLDIERLSKALKNTTDVERQALGLSTSKTENVGEDGGPIRIINEDPRFAALLGRLDDGQLEKVIDNLVSAGERGSGPGGGGRTTKAR